MRKIILTVIGLAALALAWRFTPLTQLATAHSVTQWARAFGSTWWAPAVVIAAYTPACIIMFPRPLLTLAAVVAFGPWLGLVYALSGILVAALATYFAGRSLPGDAVRRIVGSKLESLDKALQQHGWLAITALRLVPVAPFAVEGIVAGAIRIKLWHYTLGTLLGMLPGALAATILGRQMTAALESSGAIDWRVVAVVAAALGLGMVAVRKWLVAQS